MHGCPRCHTRMKTVLGESGRTEFKSFDCAKVDPLQTDAAKWAESPLSTKAA